MQQILLIFHMVFAVALVALVLVQQGKGAGMGASLGGGASQTVFGSRGAGGFLLKLTCGLGALFFATSLTLSHLANRATHQQHRTLSVVDQVAAVSQIQQQTQSSAMEPVAIKPTQSQPNVSAPHKS